MLKLNILSPERRLVEGISVEEVTVPTSEGQIQVLSGHAPMIGMLEVGIFRYLTRDGSESSGVISAGFFEVASDEVTLMAETLELQGEIDVGQAKKAQAEAEAALREANLDEHQFRKYQSQLEQALVRQQLARKEHGTPPV